MKDLPLNGLRALAMLRQTGGIRPAGRALSISPSAVHRHIRRLEQSFGTALVEPGLRVLSFTPAGDRLSRLALSSLTELAVGADAVEQSSSIDRVVVSTTESLASEWLLPRLPAFQLAHPNIEIWVRPEQRLERMGSEASIAIRMGDEATIGRDARPLWDESLVPVVAPKLAARLEGVSATDLASMPLLHDYDAQASWQRFAMVHGCDTAPFKKGARFGSSSLVLQAAEIGLGVALARFTLAQRRINAGTLCIIDHLAIDLGTAYWLVSAPRLRSREKILREWLICEARSGLRSSNGENDDDLATPQ